MLAARDRRPRDARRRPFLVSMVDANGTASTRELFWNRRPILPLEAHPLGMRSSWMWSIP